RKGSYNSGLLSSTDNAVNLARARGVNVLMMIDEAPSWASGRSDKNSPPTNPADYANFAKAMATRYRGKAAAWEVWNEENFGRFWSTGPDAARYAQLLKASYPAIKAGDPNAKVVFGGMQYNDYIFLGKAYAAMPDLGSYYDVMGTHPYTPGAAASPDVTIRDGSSISAYSFNAYREVHNLMASHGDNKPIWITEFGWPTMSKVGGVDEAGQARFTRLAYECLEQDPYVEVAFLYNLRNNWWSNDSDDWESQLGLTRTDFSHKQAYDAYKQYSPGGSSDCTYHEAGGAPTPAGTAPPAPAPAPQPTATTTTSAAKSSTTSSPSRTRTTLRVQARRPSAPTGAATGAAVVRFRVTVLGKVVGADGGRVTIELQHLVGSQWRAAGTRSTSVGRLGDFKRAMVQRGRGKWRIRAIYTGTRKKAPSKSAFVRFRI
ncbi:MAG: polysaccharide biosynthesis protein PslG, partial [Thermoleophilaceae bacterium]|nr:polysaccharide biosynthesis protein PslG [Thermoleophilaceae bacterium]